MSSVIKQAIGGCCGCGTPGCTATITGNVKGCSSLNLQGMVVEAHDNTSGGPLLGTGTTDASGNFAINATGATAGNSIVLVFSNVRFSVATTTLGYTAGAPSSTQWSCGASTATGTKTLSPTAAYTCFSGCAWPIAKTLYLTDSVYGAATLTYTTGPNLWIYAPSLAPTGANDSTFAANCGCGAAQFWLDYFFSSGIANVQYRYTTQGFFPHCPGPTAAVVISTAVASTNTCYIPGVSAFQATYSWPAGGNGPYCAAGANWTITE